MAYDFNITKDADIFYDCDKLLRYTMWEQGSLTDAALAAAIAAGTAVPKDVTGYALEWALCRSVETEVLISKTTGAGIAIVGTYNIDPDVNTQRVEVQILRADTCDPSADPVVDVLPGKYVYAIRRTDAGSVDVLALGKLTLRKAAAHAGARA